jgi:hypothetical protein
MTKTLLIASVAALAITAPAQAKPGGGHGGEHGQQAQAPQVQAEQARPERQQRQERVQFERPQRQERVQFERPQRQERVQFERPQRQERVRFERPQRQDRVQFARPQRQERVRMERPQRQERVRFERPQRQERMVERRSRNIERVRPQHIERQHVERQRPERFERQHAERQQRIERQRPEHQARIRDRDFNRNSAIERQARSFEPRQRFQQAGRDDRFDVKQLREQGKQAERLAKFQDRAERRFEQRQFVQQRREQQYERQQAMVGRRFNAETANRDWYDDFAAQRYSAFQASSPNYFYDYDDDDGYLYQVDRRNDLVTGMYPLLGGAFSIGQPVPYGYTDYNVPYAYRSLYYDSPDYAYRYGDGAIYRVDPNTQMISAVVALLTGQNFGIGQQLPLGYDVYNVPYQYRDTYYDTADSWYRYDDGYIYQVDPYSRTIQGMYPVSYGNYAVGYPVPSYASYGGYGAYAGYPSYSVPNAYQNLYYDAPGYNYQYANGGIYQVDPTTQLISALVALVTGTSLGVGQMLPAGYDAYNVPSQYRSAYFDTDDIMYRYDDGTIYQVNPRSRIIETAIPVTYPGYAAGYPIPAAYPGYAVPATYSGLYYEQPGYDYRYYDGGIYQIQPQTNVVVAPVAFVTGHTLGVGQMLPAGYDAYNVPYAYRDRYYDTADSWYRYNDGYIYQVDPQTRLIQAVIDAIV